MKWRRKCLILVVGSEINCYRPSKKVKVNKKKPFRRSVNTVGGQLLVNNGGLAVKDNEINVEDCIIQLFERVAYLEELVKRLENTIHYHRKMGEADGFGYWQLG